MGIDVVRGIGTAYDGYVRVRTIVLLQTMWLAMAFKYVLLNIAMENIVCALTLLTLVFQTTIAIYMEYAGWISDVYHISCYVISTVPIKYFYGKFVIFIMEI